MLAHENLLFGKGKQSIRPESSGMLGGMVGPVFAVQNILGLQNDHGGVSSLEEQRDSLYNIATSGVPQSKSISCAHNWA